MSGMGVDRRCAVKTSTELLPYCTHDDVKNPPFLLESAGFPGNSEKNRKMAFLFDSFGGTVRAPGFQM